jgi:cytochrome c-type biogenesis protein CcmH/NrfG
MLMLFLSPFAYSAGGSGGGSSSPSEETVKDPVLRAAKEGIAKQDWSGTQALLRKAVAANPGNADYHNLYAFATRKGPNPDMNLVFSEYAEALRLDPKHRGAHEYLGEAYLQINEVAKAREQLAALSKLCTFGCEEYSDLKQSLKQYELAHPQ